MERGTGKMTSPDIVLGGSRLHLHSVNFGAGLFVIPGLLWKGGFDKAIEILFLAGIQHRRPDESFHYGMRGHMLFAGLADQMFSDVVHYI